MGSLSRYGLSGFIQRCTGSFFPWGTLGVNLGGAFFFGLLWGVFSNHPFLGGNSRIFLLTGFMGAFTTFSTLMAETGHLSMAHEFLWAFMNLFLHILLGLGLFLGGVFLGRAL